MGCVACYYAEDVRRLCVLGSVASWKSCSALSMVEEAVSNSMLILSYSGCCGFISVGVMFSVVSVSRWK